MKVSRMVMLYGALLSFALAGAVACATEDSMEEYAEQAGDETVEDVRESDEVPAEHDVAGDSGTVINATSGCTTSINKGARTASSFCTHGDGSHRVRVTCRLTAKIPKNTVRFGPWVATRKTSSKQCAAGEEPRAAAVDARD